MSTANAPISPGSLVRPLLIGAFFGIVLIKSEVVSWFRIQEMFRFQGIHMYGVIGSAIVVAALLAVVRFSKGAGSWGLLRSLSSGLMYLWLAGIAGEAQSAVEGEPSADELDSTWDEE